MKNLLSGYEITFITWKHTPAECMSVELCTFFTKGFQGSRKYSPLLPLNSLVVYSFVVL